MEFSNRTLGSFGNFLGISWKFSTLFLGLGKNYIFIYKKSGRYHCPLAHCAKKGKKSKLGKSVQKCPFFNFNFNLKIAFSNFKISIRKVQIVECSL